MSRQKIKGVKKRKFQRLDLPLQVTLTVVPDEVIPGGVRPLEFTSRNVSLQGICLETSQIVFDSVNILSGRPGARENRLEMAIELVAGDSPVFVSGEVCWYDMETCGDEFLYQVGIVFTDFAAGAQSRLKAFLKQQRKGFFSRLFAN
ncbi:MAG: PilZ domain-containing protein [Deltaproteobacteria bacterium]|nr:PilZ domain-containing protein [Deltaproteobacteria bacterium]